MARAPRSRAKFTAARAERATDAALAKARTGDQAGHRPDPVVGLILVTAFPRDASVADPPFVGGTGLDRAPADRLAVEVRDEAACAVRLRVTAVGLLPQPVSAFLDGKLRERLQWPAACTAGTGTRTPRHASRRRFAGLPSLPSLAGTTEIARPSSVMCPSCWLHPARAFACQEEPRAGPAHCCNARMALADTRFRALSDLPRSTSQVRRPYKLPSSASSRGSPDDHDDEQDRVGDLRDARGKLDLQRWGPLRASPRRRCRLISARRR